MADTGTDHEAPDRGQAAGGSGLSRKWHGVPLWAWTLGGTVAAVVAIKWWRNRGSASSSGTDPGATDTSNCYDISGALVPCAQAAANNASGAGDLGGTLGGLYGAGDPGTTDTGSSTGTGTDTGSSTGTDTGSSSGTVNPAQAPGRLLQPVGLHTTVLGKTGVRVNWVKVPGATGYVAQCQQGSKTVNGPFDVPASQTYANFGNLKPGTTYTAWIWPSSNLIHGGPGSNQPHSTFTFTTKK